MSNDKISISPYNIPPFFTNLYFETGIKAHPGTIYDRRGVRAREEGGRRRRVRMRTRCGSAISHTFSLTAPRRGRISAGSTISFPAPRVLRVCTAARLSIAVGIIRDNHRGERRGRGEEDAPARVSSCRAMRKERDDHKAAWQNMIGGFRSYKVFFFRAASTKKNRSAGGGRFLPDDRYVFYGRC